LHNVRESWAEVVEFRRRLVDQFGPDGAIYLVSLEKRKLGVQEGMVSVCNIHIAAMMLAQESHKLATPEQIAEFKARMAVKGSEITSQKQRAEAKTQINLGDQLTNIFAQAMAQQMAGQQAPANVAAVAEPAKAAQASSVPQIPNPGKGGKPSQQSAATFD
jgi:hypothetical protein